MSFARSDIVRRLLTVIGGACFLWSAAATSAAGWEPSRNVEIVVGAAAGGSGDITARLIQRVLHDDKIVAVSTTVMNKPGGGGTLSRAYLNQHVGDGNYICIAPLNMITDHINGVTAQSFADFTPIVHLFDEYIGFAVRADSPIRNGADLLAKLRSDPGALSIGIATTRGNPNHISMALVARAAGVSSARLKTVVFNSAGEAATALLGGHIDLVPASVPVLVPFVAGGKLRLIAVTSPARLGGALANVPTWREQGVDVVFSTWTGIIGPKGLDEQQVAYWEDKLEKLSRSAEWNQALKRNYWANTFRRTTAARQYWQAQSAELKPILVDLGMAKP